MTKKKEEVVEVVEDNELQTTVNEHGIDVLCTEDTIVENVEEDE